MHSHNLNPLSTKVFSVLHADSDLLMRKIIRNVFPDSIFKLDSAANGKEAFALLEANEFQYDIVITEMYMQYANGYEIVNRVMKESPRTKTIITSNMSYLHIREGLEIVREDCFKKPLVVGKLLERVKLILQQGDVVAVGEEEVAVENVAHRRPIFELLNSEFPAPVMQPEEEEEEPADRLTENFDIELFLSEREELSELETVTNDVVTVRQDIAVNEIAVAEFIAKEEALLALLTPPIVEEIAVEPKVKSTTMSGKRWW